MLIVAALIIAAAIYLMVRRVDVRLVLLGAGLAMALLAGQPLAIADTFTRAMVTAMVAPICAAMGFAALMHATGCDRHLVHALLAPMRRLEWLVLPGGILSAYLVNVAVPSQGATAAALGPILIPLLLASGRTPTVAGAALVLIAAIALHKPLSRVPENTIKFAVGLLLSTFGTFWAVEGLGVFRPSGASVEWPAGDVSLLVLLAV